jgi:hypothetical protein
MRGVGWVWNDGRVVKRREAARHVFNSELILLNHKQHEAKTTDARYDPAFRNHSHIPPGMMRNPAKAETELSLLHRVTVLAFYWLGDSGGLNCRTSRIPDIFDHIFHSQEQQLQIKGTDHREAGRHSSQNYFTWSYVCTREALSRGDIPPGRCVSCVSIGAFASGGAGCPGSRFAPVEVQMAMASTLSI